MQGVQVTEGLSKGILVGAAVAVGLPLLFLAAYSRPGYFDSHYVISLVMLEGLIAAVCFYRAVFFPLVVFASLFAGTGLIGGGWMAGRWVALTAGAGVGLFIMLKERAHRLRGFHFWAMFSLLAALVSGAVSHYERLAFLKALSLFVLFLYASTGARLAVAGRESRFFQGLLTGIEIVVGALAVDYALGREVLGNPNSLGAVMAVAAAPILLWGSLFDEGSFAQRRRQFLYGAAMYLVFYSHSRASLLAAFLSSVILCLALRQYKLLGRGMVILVIVVTSSAILNPDAFSKRVTEFTDAFIYKGHSASDGVFGSRQSPWEGAMQSIHEHFWFGSGFGTTDNGRDATDKVGKYNDLATPEGVTSENGSSYLSILSWVGVLGVIPFVLLLFSILLKVFKTLLWMIRTGDPRHPAVPLAMVMLAGLIHAGFEDWLFAAGYYLCVYFWCLAFILADYVPSVQVAPYAQRWVPRPLHRIWGTAHASQ